LSQHPLQPPRRGARTRSPRLWVPVYNGEHSRSSMFDWSQWWVFTMVRWEAVRERDGLTTKAFYLGVMVPLSNHKWEWERARVAGFIFGVIFNSDGFDSFDKIRQKFILFDRMQFFKNIHGKIQYFQWNKFRGKYSIGNIYFFSVVHASCIIYMSHNNNINILCSYD